MTEMFKSGKEGSEIDTLAKHLKRFFFATHPEDPEAAAVEAIRSRLNKDPGISMQDIFRQIAHRKGRPSTHISGQPDGKLKEGTKAKRRWRGRKRY